MAECTDTWKETASYVPAKTNKCCKPLLLNSREGYMLATKAYSVSTTITLKEKQLQSAKPAAKNPDARPG